LVFFYRSGTYTSRLGGCHIPRTVQSASWDHIGAIAQQNRTFGPYLVAIHRILAFCSMSKGSVPCPRGTWDKYKRALRKQLYHEDSMCAVGTG
jgi:hypothetical protein